MKLNIPKFQCKVSTSKTLFCYSDNTLLFSVFNVYVFEPLIACIVCTEMLVTSMNRLSIRFGLEPVIVCIACLLLVISEAYTVFQIYKPSFTTLLVKSNRHIILTVASTLSLRSCISM